jgi:hypothetical protein
MFFPVAGPFRASGGVLISGVLRDFIPAIKTNVSNS